MNRKQTCGLIVALIVAAVSARADSLELKNGSLINGKFMGGTQTSISFQVGSSVQSYDVADIRSLRFSPELQGASPSVPSRSPSSHSTTEEDAVAKPSSSLTIPAGTQISVRTIDAIDSAKNRVGYRFQASLEEALWVDGDMVIPKGADVYGRLEESKQTGTFTGRSELRLELTGIVVHGHTVPLVAGEYELTGKSKGESTAKRTLGGAAIGSIIGALAGGGKGAAIGAGTGAGVGAGSEIITKGDQVKIPSETSLQFTLQQSVTIPKQLA
jgi:YMGG-like Gly-zipper